MTLDQDEMDLEERKRLIVMGVKQGIREFLDDRYASFGKRVMDWLLLAAFLGLVYFALVSFHWSAPTPTQIPTIPHAGE